ncbi:MAG: exodeoxyribonuclease V subunit gamma [Lysobacterales bacterium]
MLQVFRSSRIERLAEILAVKLQRLRPRSVLSPQTLIVGHLGMKRWLTQRLAEHQLPGLPRIAANLQMLLPSEWLDQLAQRVLGTEAIAIAPYRRPALRWRIYQLLPQLDCAEVARYLEGEEAPRRRFQLADRLAGLYGQYLVYRRDWLLAWERRQRSPVADHWQGQLWRQLVAEIGLSHRGQRMGELGEQLRNLPSDPEEPALHVFGVSHLPPDALMALQQLGQRQIVQLYFPDPCRELWEDLRSRAEVYRSELAGGAFLDIGHPLLAALGRMGQHFTLLLNALDSAQDDRDQADLDLQAPLPTRAALLQRLQHSLRCLRPEWVAADVDLAAALDDASLQVHQCHTRLRELEVLKDALLDRLAADPTLNPREIVVMAPNMALYAPLLPVIFGEPGRGDSALPWYLADVALARSHPLLQAFRELLDLPAQRISRSQVLALLALPAVARRLGLDQSRHQALARWLDRVQVAWGLDGSMKADFGAAPVDQNSFAFGIDRMAAGLLVGHEDPDWLLQDQFLPADPVHGPDAACLGALSALIDILQDWRSHSRQLLPATRWIELLQRWMLALFEGDPDDADEAEALRALDKLVAGITRECAQANADPEIDWPVLRDLLKTGLDGIPERQAFLAGGISFCGMVPQRAIPFRVVALLGLNDGEYPRPRTDTGLDLMQQHPRLGDRDNRMDDRYLFLEALMSARDALHLSYLAEGPQDGKPRNPALPLAELLGFLDQQHAAELRDDQGHRPWCVRHPLQPFDGRYFSADGDPRLFSYSSEYAAASRADGVGNWRFIDGPGALPATDSGAQIELNAICSYYARPSEWLCRHALGLSREALEQDASEDQEALTPALARFDRSGIDLFWHALQQGWNEIPTQPPRHLLHAGQLAAGAVGAKAFEELRDSAQALLAAARSLPPFHNAKPVALTRTMDLAVGQHRLVGTIGPLHAHGSDCWLLQVHSGSQVHFGQLLPLYLRWAALSLSDPHTRYHCALLHRDTKVGAVLHGLTEFDADPLSLQKSLGLLLDTFGAASERSGQYFARTSYEYAQALREHPNDPDLALAQARKAWLGAFASTGESGYAPGYNTLLGGNADFLEAGTEAHRRFAELALALRCLLDPPTRRGAAT